MWFRVQFDEIRVKECEKQNHFYVFWSLWAATVMPTVRIAYTRHFNVIWDKNTWNVLFFSQSKKWLTNFCMDESYLLRQEHQNQIRRWTRPRLRRRHSCAHLKALKTFNFVFYWKIHVHLAIVCIHSPFASLSPSFQIEIIFRVCVAAWLRCN